LLTKEESGTVLAHFSSQLSSKAWCVVFDPNARIKISNLNAKAHSLLALAKSVSLLLNSNEKVRYPECF